MTQQTPLTIRSQADIEAIEKLPLATHDLPASTYEMLRHGAAITPDGPALSFFLSADDFKRPFTLTHRQLLAQITRTANALRRLGIGRGDVVAYILPNLPETHYVIWGGEAAGIVLAVNPLLEATQMAEIMTSARAKWLVTLAPTPGTDIWQKASEAAQKVPGLHGILTVSVGPYLRGPKGAAFRLLSNLRRPRAGGLRILSLRHEIAGESADRLDFAPPVAGDISSYFCTGGTTGLPKIARRTHRSEVYDAWAAGLFAGDMLGPGLSALCGLPLFHVNAQLVTGLLPWSRGASVVMATPQGYRGTNVFARFWQIVARYRVYAFSGVPTVYSALLAHLPGAADISSLRFGFCGAAPMPVDLFRRFETQTGVRIIEAYGLTEGACVSSTNPPDGESRIGSIGLRLPYQQMRVVHLDEKGHFAGFAAPDEVGIIAIQGPNVFAGYVETAHEAGLWIEIDGVRWLNTGDLGRQDSDGYFWLTGRKKELIIRGGHNIDPRMIEDAVQNHPAVTLAAAIGRPDAHAGEVPVLAVQLHPEATADADAILAHAIANIPERAAHPRHLRILPAMPLTPVGKIFKPALSMAEIEDVVRVEAQTSGTALVSVTVGQDRTRGMVARIVTEGDPAPLRRALDRYAFASDLNSLQEN
ncbi:MAG: acyl-CoA synthetase [Paracoccus sp. (in: a-proteobacteria)]|uniref:acyl-CoA synthetase n=1 Tax=Paracoccus sp. TaxID=267 RepID=UPI0026DFBD33|nr:acyl-CoA synthetase [Paracoccus sp. (in: a-proteobacteria)]MDO5633052.1 acyl-CoA synthetase [Paracoccus sp. (in: a-proteobacteria)]